MFRMSERGKEEKEDYEYLWMLSLCVERDFVYCVTVTEAKSDLLFILESKHGSLARFCFRMFEAG